MSFCFAFIMIGTANQMKSRLQTVPHPLVDLLLCLDYKLCPILWWICFFVQITNCAPSSSGPASLSRLQTVPHPLVDLLLCLDYKLCPILQWICFFYYMSQTLCTGFTPTFCEVRVAQSLFFSILFSRLLFIFSFFLFCQCIV